MSGRFVMKDKLGVGRSRGATRYRSSWLRNVSASPMHDTRRLGGRTKATLTALSALAALSLLAACGTTVPLAQQRLLENTNGGLGGPGGGLGLGTSASQGAGVLGGGTTATSVGGSAAGSQGAGPSQAIAGSAGAGGSGGAGGVSGAPGSSASAVQAEDGPGVTATTINVGALYDPNAAAEDAALGAGGQNPGNIYAETNAMVAYINSHGKVAGRDIHMVWYQYSSTDNVQTQQQGACSFWTTDNKVFVMPSGTPILDQCGADAHAIEVGSGGIALESSADEARYPADYDITGITVDRSMRYSIEGLKQQGYFAPSAKIGIVTWDQDDFHYGVDHTATPELSAMGYGSVPVAYISVAQTEGDLSTSSEQISNAILQFRSAGINHVLIFDGQAGVDNAGILALLWMNAANGQQYYPAYGLNSAAGLTAIASEEPSQELKNALAVGWEPSIDLSSGDFAALPASTNQKLCLQIMDAAGQAPSGSNAEGVAFNICDQFFFLQTALDRVKGPLNQASAEAAINALGTAYPVITTFEDNFSPSQHDGPYYVRNAAFNSSCTCYKYTSNPYHPG